MWFVVNQLVVEDEVRDDATCAHAALELFKECLQQSHAEREDQDAITPAAYLQVVHPYIYVQK